MRTKHLALLALLPAVSVALAPVLARAAEEIEVETRELPDEARQELARAEPMRGDAVEVEVPESERDRGEVQFDDFYAGLAPDGNWVETPDYGWVWVPYRQAQVSDWRPYLYGEWVWTRYGWTWVSEESFGWATYHYGRWSFAPSYGWFWVPGYTWGPAWVVWRYGDSAVGWAPLYPGYVTWGPSYPFYWNHWVFVGPTHFYAQPVHHHWYHRHDVVVHHYHGTHWAHHWRQEGGHSHRVYAGPRRAYVERISSRPVRVARIETASRPGRASYAASANGGRVSVYRPDARGAIRPTGPRAPAAVSARSAAAGGAGPRPVGSGLDRPRSQLSPVQRGNVQTRATRDGRDTATVPRSNAPAVRSSRPQDRGSVGPGAGAPEGAAPRQGTSTPQQVQPQQRRVPSPGVRKPASDGAPAVRRPGASLAPIPRGQSDRQADRSQIAAVPRSYAPRPQTGAAPSYRGPASSSVPVAVRPSTPADRSNSPARPAAPSGGANLAPSRPSGPSYSPARPGAPSSGPGVARPSAPTRSAPRATPRSRG